MEITATARINADYTLQFSLCESELYYPPSYQSYDTHHNVVRDIIPGAAGTSVSLTEGVTTTVDLDFVVPDEVVIENSKLVAFVQDWSTKSVLNGAQITLPDLGPINIPNFTLESVDLTITDDDGDGKLNPGETSEVMIWLSNACDWADAENTQGILRTSNPYVTLVDSLADFGDIVQCDFVPNDADPFVFSVDPAAPAVADLDFELYLTANQSGDTPFSTTLPFQIAMNMFQANFPVEFPQPILGGNAVVDLTGSGQMEIVVAGNDSLLHVFNRLGVEISGFPVSVGNLITGSPAIGDVDNDGDLEIVVGSRDTKIYVIEKDGGGGPVYTAESYLLATPSLADLDGDGDLEIMIPGFGYDLVVIHHDGSPFAPFPMSFSGERMSRGMAVADLDEDGALDLIFGTWGGYVHALNLSGAELPGFPVEIGQRIASDPAVGDLNDDGQLEIIIGCDDDQVHAIAADGTILWSEGTATANIRTSPALGNLDTDDNLEVVTTASNGDLLVIDDDGTILTNWPIDLGPSCFSSPILADLDGDAVAEIFVGAGDSQIHAHHVDGSAVSNFPLDVGHVVQGTPTLRDLDQDGNPELVVGTDGSLVVIDLKDLTNGVETSYWSTDRGSYSRTGLYAATVVSLAGERAFPHEFMVTPAFPNPFNPVTNLRYGLPAGSRVQVRIHDLLGREVAVLQNGWQSAGWHQVTWDGLTTSGPAVTGIYYARVTAGDQSAMQKLVLMK